MGNQKQKVLARFVELPESAWNEDMPEAKILPFPVQRNTNIDRVFVVTEVDYEWQEILGVRNSQAEAAKLLEAAQEVVRQEADRDYTREYHIIEISLDAGLPAFDGYAFRVAGKVKYRTKF